MKHDYRSVIANTQKRIKEFVMEQERMTPAEEARVGAAIRISQQQEARNAFIAAGYPLIKAMEARAELLFVCQPALPLAYHEENGKRYPHISYVYGHRGAEDRRTDLFSMFEATLIALAKAGAARIMWRKKPNIEYDFTSADGTIRTQVRARFVAFTQDGAEVRVQESAEGQLVEYMRDVGPANRSPLAVHNTEPTVAEIVHEKGMAIAEKIVAETSPFGYDLVEAREDAILHCGMLIHATVEAMNNSVNEHTVSWELNRESVLNGIRRHLDNPSETAEQNHNAWMAYKVLDGWKYGTQKDAVAKTHPCLVPYSDLGPFQRQKDLVFIAIVKTYFGLEGP